MRLSRFAMTTAAVAAAAVPLSMAAPASAAADGSSAFAISASGLVQLPATPEVSSNAGMNRESVIELPANPLIEAGVLNAEAAAGHARASVADVRIAQAALSAEVIAARCHNGKGGANLTKVVLGGRQLAVTPAPNSSVNVNLAGLGLVNATLNKQVRNADGSLTVTAVSLRVGLAQGKVQNIDISSATCAPAQGGNTDPAPAPAPTTPQDEAPAPTPVAGDLPVTG